MIRPYRRRWPFVTRIGFSLFLLSGFLVTATQAGQSRYIYDELGRLHAEVDDQGNAAIYNYDAVGNLLSITRTDTAPTGVSITLFNPQKGPVGTEVTIFGSGFSPTPTQNQVTFNGTAAQALSSTVTQIVTRVPVGASTGPIAVANLNGSAASATPFTVTSPVSVEVSPVTAMVVAGTSKQFTATITGLGNQNVLWSLEGVGTRVGSISATGLYSVPSSFTGTALVIIRATSLAYTGISATATVSVLPATPLGPVVSSQVSVAIAQSLGQSGPFVAPQVSVGIDQSTVPSGPFVGSQVSVGIDRSTVPAGPFIGPQVSVGIDQSTVPSGPFVGPQVSVSLTPIINRITPSSGVQGLMNLSVTLAGTGLAGATSLVFLLNGAVDSAITAANVAANPEGTQATAQLTIAVSAPIGPRVVRIITPNGTSPVALMEGNVFSVTGP